MPPVVDSRKPAVDLSRYHDLTRRLGAFHTDGGVFLRGDSEDLQIRDAEPAYGAGEEELARVRGVARLIGSRSIPGDADAPSFGLVLEAAAILVLTSERLILMATSGVSQLGRIAGNEIHTFVFPWDLVDIISMPVRATVADRIAGARPITLFSALTFCHLELVPSKQAETRSGIVKVDEDQAMALLVRAAATHRIAVSPAHDHERLRGLVRGRYQREDDEWMAQLTLDEPGADRPAHLKGRLVPSAGLVRRRHAAALLLLDTG